MARSLSLPFSTPIHALTLHIGNGLGFGRDTTSRRVPATVTSVLGLRRLLAAARADGEEAWAYVSAPSGEMIPEDQLETWIRRHQ